MATVVAIVSIVTLCKKHHISREQFDLCTKVIANGVKAFYLVESASVPGQCYRVEWNDEHHCLQCLPHNGEACKASANGVPCWHKRAALANEEYFKAEQAARRKAEQAEIEATPEYQLEQAFRELEEALDKLDEIAAESDRREQARKDAERTRYNNFELSMGI